MPKRSWFFCRHVILPSTAFLLGCGFVAIGSRLAEGQESLLATTPQGVTTVDDDTALQNALDAATRGYVEAANARRFEALADQWTEGAELSEGGGLIVGREAIVASIRGWLEANPEARLALRLTGVKALGTSAARIRGVMSFTRKPGSKPIETRFESLRVLEGATWRLAESTVAPSQVDALESLVWMVGTWRATDPDSGATIDASYQRVAGGHVILGGIRHRAPARDGLPATEIDVVELIHPDKATGSVRSWVFDSTGARAEGVFETDGTSFNRRFVGTTADGAAGDVARWVQVIVPTGDSTCTMQSIERSLDGAPLPDKAPLHFKRQK
ncbi:MAG: nuclear transport factor 2 family protein [Planctomycetia bacterium]